MASNVIKSLDSDVVVIGGGPAGIGVAIAAARKGLSACLLEFGNSVGGIMATCMGLGQAAGTAAGKSIGEKKAVQQINHEELVQELRANGVNGLSG